jgi:hypothetical protein
MSNTRRLPPGAVPAAFSRDGKEVPPSADVVEHNLAQIIGQSVAVHLGQMLGQLLPAMPWQPDCYFCVMAAKKLVRDHQVSCANAVQAGEDQPELPEPPQVARGVTQIIVTQISDTPLGPVQACGALWACWDHIELPQQPPRQVGLVAPDGHPLVAKR